MDSSKPKGRLNDAQRRALQSAIANAEDNLFRARHTMRHQPDWKSGNGEPIAQIVAEYEGHLAALKEGFDG